MVILCNQQSQEVKMLPAVTAVGLTKHDAQPVALKQEDAEAVKNYLKQHFLDTNIPHIDGPTDPNELQTNLRKKESHYVDNHRAPPQHSPLSTQTRHKKKTRPRSSSNSDDSRPKKLAKNMQNDRVSRDGIVVSPDALLSQAVSQNHIQSPRFPFPSLPPTFSQTPTIYINNLVIGPSYTLTPQQLDSLQNYANK
jgi:hypothetical protein